MPPAPFVDQDDWTLDVRQLLREAIPLAVLVALVAVVAVIPLGFALTGIAPFVFVLLAQFVLAVGTGLVLLYVVARGVQLAEA